MIVVDSIGHVLLGGVICYALIPTADLWILIMFAGGFGAVREHLQAFPSRNHPQENQFDQFIDTFELVVGAIIFWYLREYAGLDADNIWGNIKGRSTSYPVKCSESIGSQGNPTMWTCLR